MVPGARAFGYESVLSPVEKRRFAWPASSSPIISCPHGSSPRIRAEADSRESKGGIDSVRAAAAQSRTGHRRRGIHWLASLPTPAGGGLRGHRARQPPHRTNREHRTAARRPEVLIRALRRHELPLRGWRPRRDPPFRVAGEPRRLRAAPHPDPEGRLSGYPQDPGSGRRRRELAFCWPAPPSATATPREVHRRRAISAT